MATELCAAITFEGSPVHPTEFCDDDAEAGSQYCEHHQRLERDGWDDADDQYDRIRDERHGRW